MASDRASSRALTVAQCSARRQSYVGLGGRCERTASEVVEGKPYCYQHAGIVRGRPYVSKAEKYHRLEMAARELFPRDAGFWDSRRMHWLREALIGLGDDPAPNVPRCEDLDGLECPWA